LAVHRKKHSFKNIFGAHAIGAASGLLTHFIFAPTFTLKAVNSPFHLAGLRIAVSAILAVALTAGLMRGTGWTHAPACATTLIVALGLISGPAGVIYILASVVIICFVHFIARPLFVRI